MRAIVAFRAAGGCIGPVEITLEKHIPVGAGLGGGSANAAATLRFINKQVEGLLDDKTLYEIAAKLAPMCPYALAALAPVLPTLAPNLPHIHKSAYLFCWSIQDQPLSTAAVFNHYNAVPSGAMLAN